MSFRLILYIFLTIILTSFALLGFLLDAYVFAMVCFILTVLSSCGIYSALITYQRIKLVDSHLILMKIIEKNQTLDLEKLQEWQEKRYYLRSSLRRSLILFFSNNQRLIISNKDQPQEFERLADFLVTNPITALRDHSPDRELSSSRVMPYDRERIFNACATSTSFQAWWVSPEESSYALGFNAMPEGVLSVSMHGFGGVKVMQGHFKEVSSPKFISWIQQSAINIEWQVILKQNPPNKTLVTLKAIYPSLPTADLVRAQVIKEIEKRLEQLELLLTKSQ